MASYLNSNSQVMGLRSVEELEFIIQKQVRVSGMFEALSFLSTNTRYTFDINKEDLKVWTISNDKAIALGSNQHLIGQTKNKLAYDISKAVNSGEYVAGVFTNHIDTVADATVEAKEIEFGKSTLSLQWGEFDKHLLGNISPNDVGLARKLNKGLFDYITNIDNSIFGTSAIDNSYAKKKAIYDKVVEKQAELNTLNDREFNSVAYLIVSGAKMLNLFTSPYNETASATSFMSLEQLLLNRNILVIYLSNQSDTRDYAIMSLPSAFDVYYGATPFRKKRIVMETDNITDSIYRIFYGYNNPFLVPNFEGELGMIINGGSTGINGGAVIISGASSKSTKSSSKEQEQK